MKVPKNKKFKLKDKRIIELEFLEHYSKVPSANEYFDTHTITAFIDDNKVGYIRVAYIPSENTPDFYEFFESFQGWVGLGNAYKKKDYLEVVKIISSHMSDHQIDNKLYSWKNGREYYGEPKPQNMTLWVKEQLKHYLKQLHRFGNPQYENFLEWFIDKPVVDYISVNPEERRSGIGSLLYTQCAKWMGMNGLRFYSSTCQTKAAQSSWEKLKSKYPVSSEVTAGQTRYYMDYSKR